jgi:hypothetical protein
VRSDPQPLTDEPTQTDDLSDADAEPGQNGCPVGGPAQAPPLHSVHLAIPFQGMLLKMISVEMLLRNNRQSSPRCFLIAGWVLGARAE